MLSKRKLKYFKSLHLKKYRQQHGNFLVEGAKGVLEALKSDAEIEHLVLTASFHDEVERQQEVQLRGELEIVKEQELTAAGTFSSNNAGLAVLKIPERHALPQLTSGLTLVLDEVRDPGNLGTIIRIADWYGIEHVICSTGTADLYNPKVINATMGSFTRVKVFYTDLLKFLQNNTLPAYGALLGGESIYSMALAKDALLLMGNESKGISDELLPFVDHQITIPSRGGAESLNVAIATAVTLDNFFR